VRGQMSEMSKAVPSSMDRSMAGQHRSLRERPQTDPMGTVTPAGTVVEAVGQRDFGRLAAALSDEVDLRALLPGGFKEWHGRAGVREAFTGWFDGFDEYELVDSGVGAVGGRVHFHWRLRVRAARSGRWYMVEQQVYADADADGQIVRLSVLCSGFCREGASG